MGTIDSIILKQMESAPKRLLKPMLTRKLKEAGVTAPDKMLDEFVDHLLSGSGKSFEWWDESGADEHHDLKLTFTDEDRAELEEKINQLETSLPEAILKVTERAADGLYEQLRENWYVEGAAQLFESEEFRERLEERWGEGLDLLRMLLTCCREVGAEAYKRHRKSNSKRHAYRRFVLTRLHVRACQVSDEVITLLENGFADGAMARWRTLHELAVVATLIANGDERLAERYINHDAVDVKRQADDYEQVQVPIGYPPLSKRESNRINKDYEAVLKRYGQPFASPYGWAAEQLGLKRPTFDQLQQEAGRASMTSTYKLASYNVHAGARSMFHRLGSMSEDILLSGRSNAGLVEPARNTAHSLLLITSYVADGRATLDQGAQMNAILRIRDAVAPAFEKAERRLERDERALRKARQKAS